MFYRDNHPEINPWNDHLQGTYLDKDFHNHPLHDHDSGWNKFHSGGARSYRHRSGQLEVGV